MIDYYEHIEEYLEGTLSSELRERMTNAISYDEKLRQAVEDYPIAKLISESILEDEVRGVLGELTEDETDQEIKTNGKSINTRWSPWIIGVFFIAALCIGIYQWQRYRIIENKWAQIITNEYVFPQTNITRSTDLTSASTTEKAIQYFELRELDISEEILRKIEPKNDTVHWYLANIYFLQKDFNESKLHLQKMNDSESKMRLQKQIIKIIN